MKVKTNLNSTICTNLVKETPLIFKCLFLFILMFFCSAIHKVSANNSATPNSAQQLKSYINETNLTHKAKLGAQLLEQTSNKEDKLLILTTHITTLIDLGKNHQAIPFAKQGIALANNIKDYTHQTTLYRRLAEVYWNLGQLDNALIELESSLLLAKKNNDELGKARALHNIGLIYRHLGVPDKTLEYYLKAIEIKERINEDPASTAHSYNNIGVIYVDLGDYDNAEKYYRKALSILQNEPNASIANPLHNLGQLFDKKGDPEMALQYYYTSMEYDEQNNNQNGLAVSLREIGRIYLSIEQIDKASNYLLKAKEIADNIDSLLLKASANLHLAQLNIAQGNLIEAKNLLHNGLGYAEKGHTKKNL